MSHPPKSRLAFRMGVVGHRPNRLPDDPEILKGLRARIAAALAAARQAAQAFRDQDPDAALYTPETPLLRAVSPLAEGTDRIFAEAALGLGYQLCCPMPFAQAEFEQDFAPGRALEPDSLARFRRILADAAGGAGLVTFQLDGERAREGAAYGACGRVVLNQSDLLVVVWDGREKAGEGGTVDTLREALAYHVPVLWIDALAPQDWTVLRAESDLACLAARERCTPSALPVLGAEGQPRPLEAVVAEIVAHELRLPARDAKVARAHAGAYFAERRPILNLAFVWKLFRDLVGEGRIARIELFSRDYVEQVKADWPVEPADLGERSPDPALPAWICGINKALREHYAWSDMLAERYADAHRSGGVLSYGLAALAVLIAMLPAAAGSSIEEGRTGTLFILGELVVLSSIVLLQVMDESRRWHERWTEYRLLAELIRQLKVLIPVGGGRPLPRTPIHLAGHGDPALSWMSWRLRAIARHIGLQETRVDTAYVGQCLEELGRVAGAPDANPRRASGQYGYHLRNDARCERIHTTLGKASFRLFVFTILAALLHLALRLAGPLGGAFDAQAADRWLVLTSAFLPALGAALAGIEHFGEFARLAKRSRSMADGFLQFGQRIRSLELRIGQGGGARLTEVIPVAEAMAGAMVDEVIDWRVVVLDPPRAG